jgi:two-component system sensor histidine kinase KdpD
LFDARHASVGPYLEGVLTTAWRRLRGVVIDAHVTLPNIPLVYVVPVMVAAARHGLVPSLWVSGSPSSPTTSFSCRRSTSSPSPIRRTWWRCSSSCSWPSGQRSRAPTRAQAEAARREARTNAELYAFSRKIAGVIELDDLLWIVVTHLARLLKPRCRPDAGDRRSDSGKLRHVPPSRPTARSPMPTSRGALVVGRRRPTGRGTDTLPRRAGCSCRSAPTAPRSP